MTSDQVLRDVDSFVPLATIHRVAAVVSLDSHVPVAPIRRDRLVHSRKPLGEFRNRNEEQSTGVAARKRDEASPDFVKILLLIRMKREPESTLRRGTIGPRVAANEPRRI